MTELDLLNGLQDEWVGFGDAVDFFKFDLTANQAGTYGFSLNADVDKSAKMTIYKVAMNSKGKTVLTKVKLNRDGIVQLGAGEYAVQVISADKSKGKKNTDYGISIDLPDLEYWRIQSSLAQMRDGNTRLEAPSGNKDKNILAVIG